MEVTAIIVARSGSLRVKNKNLLPFKKTTLLGNKIEQLKLCRSLIELLLVLIRMNIWNIRKV